jgi:transitional endoplasmic reticulum ATPase
MSLITSSVRFRAITTLSPSQQEAFDHLLTALPKGNIFVVWSGDGKGRTTVLQEFHKQQGGHWLPLKDYIDELRTQHPLQMEETLEKLLTSTLEKHDLVIVDDLDLIYSVICGCGFRDSYPRGAFVEAVLTSISSNLTKKKKIVFANNGKLSDAIKNRCFFAGFQKFTVADYQFLCEAFLGKKAKGLDFAKIYRFAPKLNAHQLKTACTWLKDEKIDTEIFIEYLRSQRMASNVDLGEVEDVDLRSLHGFDDVIESLEANIIVPLEQDDLATEFGIKPKRGVLLAGPPGTGKTTIGRALAHRLRSKFFLIDGTYISGSKDFYQRVRQVFEAAQNNAPSIIFIDDSDVIFENKDDFGFYRYLLTMLDGLESESNKRICVMMTTMDVGSVPPALVRSGRIELWLETRLPDRDARLAILKDNSQNLPAQFQSIDLPELADHTEGLTGADLRRLVEDGKILYAYDKARKLKPKNVNAYFLQAIETIRQNKEKYAHAEHASRARAAAGAGGRDRFRYSYFDQADDDDEA